MSVIVTLRAKADATKLEALAAKDPARFSSVSSQARPHGASYHRFCALDGEVMIVDEWPDEASFQTFFEQMSAEIGQIMAEVGMPQPEISFWRKLDLNDDIG